MAGYEITIFKNISATATPYHKDVTVIFERIKSGTDLVLVNQIRFEPDHKKQNLLKKGLPSICFSGKFRQRSAANLIKPSGLIVLDFDNFKDEAELALYKKAFCESKEKKKYTFACFLSPSGKGLKVVVKIPPTVNEHKAYFKALQEFYDDPHFDVSGSDICRVCYSSADADMYYNPDSEVWIEREINEHYEFSSTAPVLKLKTEVSIVQNLQKWFDKNYKIIKGENANHNLFILASAFNDFALPKHEAERYIQNRYGSKGTEKEIANIVKSAYKKPGGTKFFEDKQSLELIERQVRSGIEKKKIIKKLFENGGHEEEDVENAIKSISDSLPVSEFWYFTDTGKCAIKNHKYKAYLEQQGFYKLYPEGAENFVFVKIENNMIENVTASQIKDYTLEYLHGLPNIAPFETMSDNAKYFKEDYLNMIDKADVAFFEDNTDKCVVYFNNGAAIVKTRATPVESETAFGKTTTYTYETKVELVDYLNISGYVWKNHIINRDYERVDFKDCEFDRFLYLIAGKDPEKLMSIKSTIGYLMHSFKTSANNKAVILNDEKISDTPEGGSGKGLFCSALGYMKRVAKLDGKTFDGQKSFAYQTVSADTQVLVYDDVPRNFHFENLFSIITEGITLEKKNKDAIKLSVTKSPKIIVTTNYTIGGVGGSFDRRKWEIEFSSYFNSGHTPNNEFGHDLFTEWSELEWKKFDNLMIDCVRIYLENGLIKQEFTNLAERKFIKETSFDFHEWIKEEPLPLHTRLMKGALFTRFVDEYPDHKIMKWFTQKRFAMWLDMYGKYKGHKIITGKDIDGRYIMFVSEGNTQKEVDDLVAAGGKEEDFPF